MEDAAFGLRSCIIIGRKEKGKGGVLHFIHGGTCRPENFRIGLTACLTAFWQPVRLFDKFFSCKGFHVFQQIFGHDFQIA